jgi:hypothetical protein
MVVGEPYPTVPPHPHPNLVNGRALTDPPVYVELRSVDQRPTDRQTKIDPI